MRFKIYDNGGETMDRYTVYYLDDTFDTYNGKMTNCVGMSEHPFHGIGQHGHGVPGKHNGKVITFDKLPKDCQQLVRQDLKDYGVSI